MKRYSKKVEWILLLKIKIDDKFDKKNLTL